MDETALQRERLLQPPSVPPRREEKPDKLVSYIVVTDPATGRPIRLCSTPGCSFVDKHAGACSHLLQLEGKRSRKLKRPADF